VRSERLTTTERPIKLSSRHATPASRRRHRPYSP